jgi:multiple sugar transport system ATP-binding protein
MSYLVLESLTKRFRRETVLDGASLAVEQGETVVVFGPSGCGKTVLLRLIAGIHEPDAGSIRIGDQTVTHLAPEHRDLGMAFQNFALYPHMSAFDNIASPLRARGLGAAEVSRRVEEVATLLKIEHVLGHLPRALSNGQKQRTSLARSLAPGPSVLLLDDPLRNVDAKLRYEMRLELPRVLKAFNATVLYVTQDYKEAMALGHRVAVLMGGRFVQVDQPARLYTRPISRDVARLFGDPTINLYEAHAENGAIELFEVRFPVPAAAGPCLVGIRPEHVEVGMEQRPGAIPVELDAVTPLNVRAVLLLKTKVGQEILATCWEDEAARFPRGHRAVWATLRPDDLMLFDATSGARLAPRVH